MATSFEYKGVTYPHTESPWVSRTNRHTSTRGYSWGWIDGPIRDGGRDYTWSNDPGESFTSSDAAEVVRIHNEWLEEQEPLVFRLIKAERNMTALSNRFRETQNQLTRVKEELDESIEEVDSLRKQVASSELVRQA